VALGVKDTVDKKTILWSAGLDARPRGLASA
jgi:hypothetical protein